MPELPEVETIARALRNGGRGGVSIVGRTIVKAQVFWPRTLAEPDLFEFQSRIVGQRVESVGRRGKFFVIQLEQDTLLIHLRMSGDLRVESTLNDCGEVLPLQTHDRAVFLFTGDQRLVFNNPRKFGRVWLVRDPARILGKLGPEPLDESLTGESFFGRLNAHHRQIKTLLLDQTFIAGLGNIYTDEALFLAKINPRQSSDYLNLNDAERLLRSIREVLLEGIARNGSSIDWVYRGGSFQNSFHVYQRTGKPCTECGNSIERCLVGQRSTHFCPKCQPIIAKK